MGSRKPKTRMENDYLLLAKLQGKRIRFCYDTGAQIVGRLRRCLPEGGIVELAQMEDVDIIASDGTVLEHHWVFSFVPNKQMFFEVVDSG